MPTLTKLKVISIEEKFEDLQQEVEDAQFTLDNDKYNLENAKKAIAKSLENYKSAYIELEIFKLNNNLK